MSTIKNFNSLNEIAQDFRKDLEGDNRREKDLILLFAHNGSGKTRLSMEFKEEGKEYEEGNVTQRDTLYFNAFTEDLFSWDNDFENNTNRKIKLNTDSAFFNGLDELELDIKIANFLNNYVDFRFDIDYSEGYVKFSKDEEENIKISRGEETIFIWCFFLAICQLAIDNDPAYSWVNYIYIDDPVSFLDENNAIAIACDLCNLLVRRENDSDIMSIKTVISTHHSLFFNVLFNEFGRKVKSKRYFLHNKGENYALQDTSDTPFFHHIATLSELKKVVETNEIYTYHFNALRSILEKTATFFGYDKIDKCIVGFDEDEILFERALQLFSHGKYSIFDPVEMGDDSKELFKRILNNFLEKYEFYFPEIFNNTETEI